ncbi:zinc metallopeptidase [Mycobacteroides abscessus subsp. abscessus]|nr:zinc metallopeptidase [Mycobacteroides abscessus subsp. abscessus]
MRTTVGRATSTATYRIVVRSAVTGPHRPSGGAGKLPRVFSGYMNSSPCSDTRVCGVCKSIGSRQHSGADTDLGVGRPMTFNEGMQIDTSTTSGGGMGRGPKMAIGGGVGGLLIAVVVMLLGGDPSQVLQQQGPQQAGPAREQTQDFSHCKTGADANKSLDCRIIATGNSVDAVWTQILGPKYPRPNVKLFSNQVNTGCGAATTEVGPFYCPADRTAYFDTSFFQVLVDQFGSSGGPLAQEYVVAHEYGHHVQNLFGVLGKNHRCAEGQAGGGVCTELQADCYAGVWAKHASTTVQEGTGVPFLKPLTEQDIRDALSAASSVGDDRIQKRATGRVNPEAWSHGSSEQRQRWFTQGYNTGDFRTCDTFNAQSLN